MVDAKYIRKDANFLKHFFDTIIYRLKVGDKQK